MPDWISDADLAKQFLPFVKAQAAGLRANEVRPKSLDEWRRMKSELRKSLEQSWGEFPDEPCPLQPRKLGELQREGYAIEKIVFQTRPDVWMTSNLYLPAGKGRHPAVLCVHGHWRGAKQDPVVQARCIGLAKLGYVVLAVDAFGAGERGLGRALGEYHGEMVAATLWPSGLALAGLQVYENMRAVDYLQSRVEVEPTQIGITGTSGGGNQTMYAGAYDERFGCVVPTCSVGTYDAYLGAACCMCEVTPAALTYTEEWGLLAMVAPRGLMVSSATRDAFQFSVGEAAKSIAVAKTVFDLHGKAGNARHAIFESKHDYNQPMREAMYGWMTLHLKGDGDGSPIAEPEMKTEEPEALRCFPGETRPASFLTLPQFAARESRSILVKTKTPDHVEHWDSEAQLMLHKLVNGTLGNFPKRTELRESIVTREDGGSRELQFESEPGITIAARHAFGNGQRTAVLLDFAGREAAARSDLAGKLHETGWGVVTADLRASGAASYASDKIGRAIDHNSAEWSMWIGRPLLGQWAWDVTRLLDAIEETGGIVPAETTVIGNGPAGIVAITAAVLDWRISQVAAINSLASFVSDQPYEQQRLGIMVPHILAEVGDIPQLAALVAPRRVVIAGGVDGGGKQRNPKQLADDFDYARRIYRLENADAHFTVCDSTAVQEHLK